jgi:hypothetical protein
MIIEQYGEASPFQRLKRMLRIRHGYAAVGVTKRFRKDHVWMYV